MIIIASCLSNVYVNNIDGINSGDIQKRISSYTQPIYIVFIYFIYVYIFNYARKIEVYLKSNRIFCFYPLLIILPNNKYVSSLKKSDKNVPEPTTPPPMNLSAKSI